MLKFTLLGALCMLGTLWLVVRCRSSVRAGGLAIAVVAVYLWSLMSMLATLARTTLLSFRLQPTLTVLLATAGVFGFIEVTLALAARGRERAWGRSVLPVAASIGLAGAIAFSQDIPDVLRPDLTIAYTDTDGHGQRGDRRPPSSEKFYPEIDTAITRATGKPRNQTVVLTADYSFLSYYPYYGFQGLTSHYANPLAQFDKRAATIKSWAKLTAPDQLIHALDTLPWRAADGVFDASCRLGRRRQHVHAAAGRRRVPQPAQRAPLHRGAQRRDIRRPSLHRHQDRPVRVGGPQTLMATEATEPRPITI